MKDEKELRVLIVDDHSLVRKGIRSMLESYGDIQVVGEASNGIEAIMLTEQLHPSIVLMDINMPKMNGVEATTLITNDYPGIIVIGLSVNASTESQETMRRAGAVQLISKDKAADWLYDMIQESVQSPVLSTTLGSQGDDDTG